MSSNSSTHQRGGTGLALAASAIFLGGTIAASLAHSTAGWADALLAGPVVIAAILFAATAWVVRSRPAAATRPAGIAFVAVAFVAGAAITAAFALTAFDARLLLYALPLGSALQLAALARSLSEGRVARAANG